jgi:hypothetical protein
MKVKMALRLIEAINMRHLIVNRQRNHITKDLLQRECVYSNYQNLMT